MFFSPGADHFWVLSACIGYATPIVRQFYIVISGWRPPVTPWPSFLVKSWLVQPDDTIPPCVFVQIGPLRRCQIDPNWYSPDDRKDDLDPKVYKRAQKHHATYKPRPPVFAIYACGHVLKGLRRLQPSFYFFQYWLSVVYNSVEDCKA